MKWLRASGWYIDGIVAKNSTDVYVPGERVMQKYKLSVRRIALWVGFVTAQVQKK